MTYQICQHYFAKFLKNFLVLKIEQTMAVTLEIGVCDLLTEFFANTLVLFCPFPAAGTVASGLLETLFDHLYHLVIRVQFDCHIHHSFLLS